MSPRSAGAIRAIRDPRRRHTAAQAAMADHYSAIAELGQVRAEALEELLAITGMSRSMLARELGVSASAITKALGATRVSKVCAKCRAPIRYPVLERGEPELCAGCADHPPTVRQR